MLKGVRDRLRSRRRRQEPHPVSPSPPPSQHLTPAVAPADPSQPSPVTPSTAVVPVHPPKADDTHQPRVFRNRSLEYAARQSRDPRQLLGLFSTKGLRTFHRGRTTPDKSHSSRDRPLNSANNEQLDTEQKSAKERNDDSFSSLPSTHASRDPFLNDDVPVEISRIERRKDRPRAQGGRRDSDDPFARVVVPSPLDSASQPSNNGDVQSPPASFSSSSTSRKRSSLWKRTYDPNNEFQTKHERNILRAVALSESSVKEQNVIAAQQLATIVDQQIIELDSVLQDVDKRVENARTVSESLPSTRDVQFEPLLYSSTFSTSREGASAKAEAERVFRELQWTEKVWDVEALLAEKRFEDCVINIERLRDEGISSSASPRTVSKYESIIQQLASEMSICCTQSNGDTASIHAPLLARLGMAAHAREVVLNSAEGELMTELRYLSSNNHEMPSRVVSTILDKTLAIFKRTHSVYTNIACSDSENASSFVAWVVEQSDNVYGKFIAPVFGRLRKADPVAILATIEAARHRKAYPASSSTHREKSLVALLETRITAHVRGDLEVVVHDAERQLVDRARMYASAIPRNWREGAYESGKAVCDELNTLSRGLEGALMNLGTEADVLAGNLLVRPALEYSTTLIDMSTKALSEDDTLTKSEVQRGVCETLCVIGATVSRLHERFARIPSLDRVASVLSSWNLGEVRILQAEIQARRAPSPSLPVSTWFVADKDRAAAMDGASANQSSVIQSIGALSFLMEEEKGLLTHYSVRSNLKRDASIGVQEQAKRVIAQQRRITALCKVEVAF